MSVPSQSYSASADRAELARIVVPSGVHAGAPCSKSPLVNCRGAPPVAGTTNTWRNPYGRYPSPSCRYHNRSSTIVGSAHFAPRGFSGIFTGWGVLAGTSRVNAISRPLGDHAMFDGD